MRTRFVPAVIAIALTVACTSAPGPTGRPAGVRTVWRWDAPSRAEVGAPAADDAGVVATYGNIGVVALDQRGRRQWEVGRVGAREVAPTLAGGAVVIATDEGVVALDRLTGSVRWAAGLGDRASTAAVVDGTAVVTLWEGGLAALDLADGAPRWRHALGGPALGPPAVARGTAVATWEALGGAGAGLAAVDLATGRRLWEQPLVPGGVSAPAIAGATVVVVAGDLAVHGFDLRTGAPRWATAVGAAGSPEVPPRPVPGGVVAGDRRGGLHAVDAGTGALRWSERAAGAVVRGGSPAPAARRAWALPLDDGRLLVAGPARRQVLDPPGLVAGAAAGPGGVLVVASGLGDGHALIAYEVR